MGKRTLWVPPSNWEVYEPLTLVQAMKLRREDWLAEMCERFGIVPAEDAVRGVSTLVKVTMPEVYGSEPTFKRYRHLGRGEEAYADLEALGLLDRDDVHEMRVSINWAGKFRTRKKTHVDILVDKRGRGTHKAKWRDRQWAERAVLWRLPAGSRIVK